MAEAFSLAEFKAGNNNDARIAMIEITIKSSIRVKFQFLAKMEVLFL